MRAMSCGSGGVCLRCVSHVVCVCGVRHVPYAESVGVCGSPKTSGCECFLKTYYNSGIVI